MDHAPLRARSARSHIGSVWEAEDCSVGRGGVGEVILNGLLVMFTFFPLPLCFVLNVLLFCSFVLFQG